MRVMGIIGIVLSAFGAFLCVPLMDGEQLRPIGIMVFLIILFFMAFSIVAVSQKKNNNKI